ncbi:unnamed protein product [Rhodiola kirilowii]
MAFQQHYYNTDDCRLRGSKTQAGKHSTFTSCGTGNEMHAPRHYRNPWKRKILVTGQSADIPYYCTSEETTWTAEIHHFEKEAYTAVLRAFKIQADSISWEKESLISNLRKELRLSNEEHGEILGKIKLENCNQRIRESRQAFGDPYGIISVSNMSNDIVPLPNTNGRRGLSKFRKHGNVVKGLNDPVQPPSSGPNGMGKVAFDVSSNIFANKTSGLVKHNHLLGQKVRTRCPHDHNFYDAVVSRYDPARGLHALSFNFASGSDDLEWVDLTKIPPGDIQWVNDSPEMSSLPHIISLFGTNTSLARQTYNVSAGRGKRIPKSRPKSECLKIPGCSGKDTLEVKIRKTNDLLESVTRLLGAGNVDPCTVGEVKEVLKEHEKALVQVLESLADVSDDE